MIKCLLSYSIAVALLMSFHASSLALVLPCSFTIISGAYTCTIYQSLVLVENEPITFSGTHLAGKGTGHVIRVDITKSRIIFVISQLFHLFLGINTFSSVDGGLEKIQENAFVNSTRLSTIVIDSSDLRSIVPGSFNTTSPITSLTIKSGNLRKIDSGVLAPLAQLQTLIITNSSIQIINESAFDTLVNVKVLNLTDNQIEFISNNTLRRLNSLVSLNLAGNLLQRLDGDWFLQNGANVVAINLRGNKINKIHPKFIGNLVKLNAWYMLGNNCSTLDVLNTTFPSNFTAVVHKSLETCYTRYLNDYQTTDSLPMTEDIPSTSESWDQSTILSTYTSAPLTSTHPPSTYTVPQTSFPWTTQTIYPPTWPTPPTSQAPPIPEVVKKYLMEFRGQFRVVDDEGTIIITKNVSELFRFN